MENQQQNPQEQPDPNRTDQHAIEKALKGLRLRSIGPAVMGGRIADIAVHPTKKTIWYVAVGSGGVWKTTNAGTTWKPVFDDQPVYSIGCVTIDPHNPNIIWVGTGENVSGRHVAWGDGVYKSLNGGETWECMGLKESEHISRIIVDPRDSDTVFVAAEGPLWSSGGERGVFKTTDGGANWEAVLEIDQDTGVTDVLFAPNNPNVVYAAAYQRRRKISSFMGGGPSSGVYKSMDGGDSWRKINVGLPKGDMGKIGLAVTPADPNLVYATIEAKEEERGFYRSGDQGESWERRNEYLSGGTGPHYYQEIEASPVDPQRVYQMDVFVHVTRDGGKTFSNMETGKDKHSDNHALWIDPVDGDHLIVGSDGGLYESFDEGGSWRHFPNLPISQFYRVAVDQSEPFYNIMGGAQDLGTLLGPSRTLNQDGVRNADWTVPLGADGYHVAFDPNDLNTMYLEWQNGNVMRYDRRSNERQDIQPKPEPGDDPERWNWDTPILISPHNSNRIYVASQRLWRSDDRGDSWTPISGDLTRNLNRYELELMGKVWSVDDLYDLYAMSEYNTITHISESPIAEGVLYVGTDDGLIQVTEDGGQTWRTAAELPDMPEMSFVNDVEASQHDGNAVFAVIDAHQFGDYRPYIYESTDRGRSWRSISGDLPEGTIVWALEQDHVAPNLLFIGTEFGLYFTPNRGQNWYQLKSSVPTIAFRDIKLQRRDNDLVGASFGRGFYVLDDYSPLRLLTEDNLKEKATLFPVRDAWWYVPNIPMQSAGQPTLGTTAYRAENPPFGAVFTYHLSSDILSLKKQRHEKEKKLREAGENVPFPGWDALKSEADDLEANVILIVRTAKEGLPIRRIKAEAQAGLHRTAWDLRLAPPDPIDLTTPEFSSPWESPKQGSLVAPGQYRVTLAVETDGGIEELTEQHAFEVKAVQTHLPGADFDQIVDFQQRSAELMRRMYAMDAEIGRTEDRIKHLKAALVETPGGDEKFLQRIAEINRRLSEIKKLLIEDSIRKKYSASAFPAMMESVSSVVWNVFDNRLPPTNTQKMAIENAAEKFDQFRRELTNLIDHDLAAFESDMAAAGAPWTPGRRLR